ncbi:MAG TPA: type 1 glutamine amidotransferase [Geobacteraceae bacterium]|nr:type 1 glutamine amidotransferase [Geobacteraceae bacterium]
MLLIIQNDPEVPPGNFSDAIIERGIPCQTIHPYAGDSIPQVRDLSAAIVFGGAMGVHDIEKHPFLTGVKGFIRSCLQSEIPFLGICLGGQFLADILGGRVISGSPHGEKGTRSVTLTGEGENDPLFAGITHEFVSFQWHNDSFEVPVGGTLLATSPACPAQAFRFGSCAWGTQFHPEVNRTIVDSWARCSEETAPLADQYVAAFVRKEHAYMEVSQRLLGNFLRIAGLWR